MILERLSIKIKLLNQEAIIPFYANNGDAGLDLFSIEEREINPGETVLIKTGIAIELPEGYESQIRPRSGLALKNSITVLNTPGTIDSGYRGEIGVILINHGKIKFIVKKKTKIAQMVINKYEKINFEEVNKLADSKRSEGGFGSTGQ